MRASAAHPEQVPTLKPVLEEPFKRAVLLRRRVQQEQME